MRSGTRASALVLAAIVSAGCSGGQSDSPRAATPTPSLPVPSVSPTAEVASGVPLASVDWTKAVNPELGCGAYPSGEQVDAGVDKVAYVEPVPGRRFAVVLAGCVTGAGSPPSGLFTYDRASSRSKAHLAQVLLSPDKGQLADSFTVGGPAIDMTVWDYSSAALPRCCPDLQYTSRWTWSGDSWRGPVKVANVPGPWALKVTASPDPVGVGGELTYVLSVTNRGSTALTDARLSETFPAGTVWVSSTACSAPNGQNSECALGTLAPGASTTITIKVRVSEHRPMVVNRVMAFGNDAAGTHSAITETPTKVRLQARGTGGLGPEGRSRDTRASGRLAPTIERLRPSPDVVVDAGISPGGAAARDLALLWEDDVSIKTAAVGSRDALGACVRCHGEKRGTRPEHP